MTDILIYQVFITACILKETLKYLVRPGFLVESLRTIQYPAWTNTPGRRFCVSPNGPAARQSASPPRRIG